MAQLIVSIEDDTLLQKIQNAISLLRGVNDVKIATDEEENPNATTIEAINSARKGEVVFCSDFEDYLNKVK